MTAAPAATPAAAPAATTKAVPAATIPAVRELLFRDEEALLADLAECKLPALRAIARGFGWRLTGQRRDDVVAQIARYYADPAETAAAVATLEPALRQLLGVVAWLGPIPRHSIRQAFDRVQAALPEASRMPKPFHDGPGAISAAVAHGLMIFVVDPATVHEDLRVPWPLAVAVPPPAWTPTINVPRGWAREPAGDGVADVVAAALALVAEGELPTHMPFADDGIVPGDQWPLYPDEVKTNAGHWSGTVRIPAIAAPLKAEPMAAIGRALGDPDDRHGAFILAQMASQGLFVESGEDAVRLDPASLDDWLALPAAARLAETITGWIGQEYPSWDEVSLLVGADGRLQHRRQVSPWHRMNDDYYQQRTALRVEALFGLHRLPRALDGADAGWVDGPALAKLVAAAHPAAYLPMAEHNGWFVADASGQPLRAGSADADRFAAALLAALLRGPMRWLGLVETAVAPKGDAWAVRLAPLGRALVAGGAPAEADAPSGTAVAGGWDADKAVVTVIPRWDAADALAVVWQCADYVGPADEGARSPALRFQLRPSSVRRAFDAGLEPADVADRFAGVGLPLPPAVASALDEWWARWGTVNQYAGLALIELADEHQVQVLGATTDLNAALVYRAGPTTLVVREDAVDGLLAQLRTAGHTPRVVVGQGDPPPARTVPQDTATAKAARPAAKQAPARAKGRRSR